MNSSQVQALLKFNNYGPVGGMFNILAHLQLLVNKEMGRMLRLTPSSNSMIGKYSSRTIRSKSLCRQNSSSSASFPSRLKTKSVAISEESLRKTKLKPQSSVKKTTKPKARVESDANTRWNSAELQTKPSVVKGTWNGHPEPRTYVKAAKSQATGYRCNQNAATENFLPYKTSCVHR